MFESDIGSGPPKPKTESIFNRVVDGNHPKIASPDDLRKAGLNPNKPGMMTVLDISADIWKYPFGKEVNITRSQYKKIHDYYKKSGKPSPYTVLYPLDWDKPVEAPRPGKRSKSKDQAKPVKDKQTKSKSEKTSQFLPKVNMFDSKSQANESNKNDTFIEEIYSKWKK